MPYRLTERARAEAQRFGLDREYLKHMLDNCALFTHSLGNRRFHDWVFRINGERVISISRLRAAGQGTDFGPDYRCEKCNDTGEVTIYDKCHVCQGEKCSECGFEGIIPSKIECDCQLEEL